MSSDGSVCCNEGPGPRPSPIEGADAVRTYVSNYTADQTTRAAHAGRESYRARRTFGCDRLPANASRPEPLMRSGMPPDQVVVDLVMRTTSFGNGCLAMVPMEAIQIVSSRGSCPVPCLSTAIESRWRPFKRSRRQLRDGLSSTARPTTRWRCRSSTPPTANVVRGRPTCHLFGIGGRRRLDDPACLAWPTPSSTPTNCTGQ